MVHHIMTRALGRFGAELVAPPPVPPGTVANFLQLPHLYPWLERQTRTTLGPPTPHFAAPSRSVSPLRLPQAFLHFP
ncbi:hypothetical protein AB1N83_008375 [Pleurotus pulmonarius]